MGGVVLSAKAFGQLFGYAEATDREICCLGAVKRTHCHLEVEEFFLVRQEGSAAHTELEDDAVADLVSDLLTQGRGDVVPRLKCWAHSHPGMGCFWSSTDHATCRRLCADYLVSVVVSDGYALRARLDVNTPIALVVDHLPVYVQLPEDPTLAQACRQEVEAKVKPGLASSGARRIEVWFPKDDEPSQVEIYCARCGNWHGRGECFFDMSQGLDDDEDFFFGRDDPWGDAFLEF